MPFLPLVQCMLTQARQKQLTAEQILERAQACDVEPLIWCAVESGRIVGDDFGLTQACLMQFKIQQTARLGIWRKSAETALKALSSPCILLKGEPMGVRLMGNAMWRMTHDIDLWLPQDQIDTAEKALAGAGWRRTQEPHTWATNQILLEHEVLAPIELHWALAPRPWQPPNFECAYQRALSTRILQTQAYILSDEDQWLHLLIHAHQHYFALKTVFDLLAARSKLQAHPEFLKPYHLCRLNAFVHAMLDAISSPDLNASYRQNLAQWMTQMWFKNLLSNSKRGELIFGEDNAWIAAAGVLIRALSMGLLDGYRTPMFAALDVIFAGPHPIGKRCHKLYDAIVPRTIRF